MNQVVKAAVDLDRHMLIGIPSLALDPFWHDKTSDASVPEALDEAVSKKLTDLVSLLHTYCEPSLAKIH